MSYWRGIVAVLVTPAGQKGDGAGGVELHAVHFNSTMIDSVVVPLVLRAVGSEV